MRVPFDADKINAMLGTDISEEEMLGYFRMIGFEYDAAAKEIIAPTFRHDLFRLADIARKWRDSTDTTISRRHFPQARRQRKAVL